MFKFMHTNFMIDGPFIYALRSSSQSVFLETDKIKISANYTANNRTVNLNKQCNVTTSKTCWLYHKRYKT